VKLSTARAERANSSYRTGKAPSLKIVHLKQPSKNSEFCTVFLCFKVHRLPITFFASSDFSGTKSKIKRALNKNRDDTIVAELGMSIESFQQYWMSSSNDL